MKSKMTRLNIRIDYDLKDKIEKEAGEAGLTQTDLVLNAIEARIDRQLLVKMKLAEWKIETQVDLRNWEHRQSYNLEELRLNCLHGVLPASRYDNPDSGLRKTKLEDLNKPTVVVVEDEDTNIDHQLEKMVKEVEAMEKAPVEDEDTNTDRNDDIPKVKSILEGIKEKMAQAEDSLKDSLKDS